MLNRVVPAAAEGLSVINTAIDPSGLASLTFDQLSSVHDAAVTLANVTAAFCCQPRFVDGHIYNAAGEVIADLNTLLCELREAALQEVRRRQPTDAEDRAMRSWVILLDAATSRDGVDMPETMDTVEVVR